MKKPRLVASLLAALLLASAAQSQTSNPQLPDAPSAQCRYPASSSRPPYPQSPYYCAAPRSSPSGRGALIGGAIGFTLGAARPNAGTAKDRLTFGLILGLIGAGIGATIPASPYHHFHHPPRWQDDDEDAQHRAPAKPNAPQSSHAWKPIPSDHAPGA